MTRKQPTPSTIKQLFALSGNICANPECTNLLTKGDTVLGEICHIEAAEPDGPRYNSKSNDEYRRSFENLMLLCTTCHTIIDRNEDLYPVEQLRIWKAEHERKFKHSQFKISDAVANK